jgi:hypothetical protein
MSNRRYEVDTKIAGSHCVVFRHKGDGYLDARRKPNNHTHIEVVHGGHVSHSEVVPNDRAPQRIIQLMRKGLRP